MSVALTVAVAGQASPLSEAAGSVSAKLARGGGMEAKVFRSRWEALLAALSGNGTDGASLSAGNKKTALAGRKTLGSKPHPARQQESPQQGATAETNLLLTEHGEPQQRTDSFHVSKQYDTHIANHQRAAEDKKADAENPGITGQVKLSKVSDGVEVGSQRRLLSQFPVAFDLRVSPPPDGVLLTNGPVNAVADTAIEGSGDRAGVREDSTQRLAAGGFGGPENAGVSKTVVFISPAVPKKAAIAEAQGGDMPSADAVAEDMTEPGERQSVPWATEIKNAADVATTSQLKGGGAPATEAVASPSVSDTSERSARVDAVPGNRRFSAAEDPIQTVNKARNSGGNLARQTGSKVNHDAIAFGAVAGDGNTTSGSLTVTMGNAPVIRDGIAGRSRSEVDAPAPTAHEPFAVLDADVAVRMPASFRSGSHHAEAGFQDPALGWVAVRAETSGSGIHATLVPDSAGAAAVLSGHMAGLNAYLTEHHPRVETLTMAVPESGTMSAAEQGMHRGGQEQSPAGQTAAGREPANHSQPKVASIAVAGRETEMAHAGRGTHISVMA